MVLLARVLGKRWAVTGADNDAGAMKRATSLALREGVARQLATLEIDVRRQPLPLPAHACAPPRSAAGGGEGEGGGGGGVAGGMAGGGGVAGGSSNRWRLVHGSRFLDRRVLPVVRDSLLAPNGLFVWSTFLQAHSVCVLYSCAAFLAFLVHKCKC